LTQTMSLQHSARAVSAAAIGLAVVSAASPALAAVPEWIAPTRLVLDPALIYLEFAFVCRIVLSWYPKMDLNRLPLNLVAWPTEPLLKPTRAVVPPAFGVDVSPIVWVLLLSFLREVLLGQQGVLTLLAQKG
jgi:YggT family protein